MIHILDNISRETNKLEIFMKKYIKTSSSDDLKHFNTTRQTLEILLKQYGAMLKEEDEIFGDLEPIISHRDKQLLYGRNNRKK